MNIQQYYWLIYPLAILDIILKGFALWFAARVNHKYWFIVLLLINSLGVLPLVYLIFFAKGPEIERLRKKFTQKRR